MRDRFAFLATGLASVGLVAALMSPARAGEMRPEDAKRFIADKLFTYTCFDGTHGVGRIHSDGSVIGTLQASGGPTRFVTLPSGTIHLTSDSICASLPRALIQPCFNVVQTSPNSFRGSLRTFTFAYCDFVRRNARYDLTRRETPAHPMESTIALRPSRY
jgi:hypothetical protein